jgi:hypothetical protein
MAGADRGGSRGFAAPPPRDRDIFYTQISLVLQFEEIRSCRSTSHILSILALVHFSEMLKFFCEYFWRTSPCKKSWIP